VRRPEKRKQEKVAERMKGCVRSFYRLCVIEGLILAAAEAWLGVSNVLPFHSQQSTLTKKRGLTSRLAETDSTAGEVDAAPYKQRRKKNKYANFSKVKEETDPFEELLAESHEKQSTLQQEKEDRRKRKRRPKVVIPPALTNIEYPDTKEIDPYDPTTFGYIEVGHLTGAHGVHGWLKVKCATDFPTERLCTVGIRHLKPYNKRAPRQVTLLQGKHRLEDEYLIQLQEVEDRDTAAKLRGATLYVREEEKVTPPVAKPEDPEEFIVSDLVNLEVFDQQTHNLVGKVVGVVLAEDMSSVPGLGQDLLEVMLQKGPLPSYRDTLVLIPLVPQIVPVVQVLEKKVFIDPPAGLLDLTYFREERVRIKGFLPPCWDENEGDNTVL
jgi:16S rRNA processing protein RimM